MANELAPASRMTVGPVLSDRPVQLMCSLRPPMAMRRPGAGPISICCAATAVPTASATSANARGLITLRFGVDRVVGDRLRLDFLPPVRRLRRNGDDVALLQLVRLTAVHARRANLPRRGVLGSDQRPAGDERCLALDDDEDVIRLVVNLDFARTATIGEDDEALVVHDLTTLG